MSHIEEYTCHLCGTRFQKDWGKAPSCREEHSPRECCHHGEVWVDFEVREMVKK